MLTLFCSLAMQAQSLASFLLPMLEYLPEKRATAAEMLHHPWLDQKALSDSKHIGRETAASSRDRSRSEAESPSAAKRSR